MSERVREGEGSTGGEGGDDVRAVVRPEGRGGDEGGHVLGQLALEVVSLGIALSHVQLLCTLVGGTSQGSHEREAGR